MRRFPLQYCDFRTNQIKIKFIVFVFAAVSVRFCLVRRTAVRTSGRNYMARLRAARFVVSLKACLVYTRLLLRFRRCVLSLLQKFNFLTALYCGCKHAMVQAREIVLL